MLLLHLKAEGQTVDLWKSIRALCEPAAGSNIPVSLQQVLSVSVFTLLPDCVPCQFVFINEAKVSYMM